MSYDELAESPQETLSESSGSTAQRMFLVDSANRLEFAQYLVGSLYPNFPQCRVNSVSIKPWSGDIPPNGAELIDPTVQTADYAGKPALITISYGPDFTQKTWPTDMPKPSVREGTELRFNIGGSGQFLLIPSNGCKWQDSGEDLQGTENSRILLTIREIQIQWDFVDDPPLNTLDGLLGHCNETDFLGCEPETLLFEQYSVEESFRAAPLNPHTNRVQLTFRKRRIQDGSSVHGWNHDYRASPAGWAKVLFKSDDEPRYSLEDMTNMFA